MPLGFGDRETAPAGTIVAFSRPLSEIPSGWALCDGNNGTPNMLDRFPKGANAGENPGDAGGQNSYTLSSSQMRSHNHSTSMNQSGYHDHSVENWNGASSGTGSDFTVGLHIDDHFGSDVSSSSVSGSSGSHSHSASLNTTGGDASIDNRPAYHELAFIMKL
jgi:microcystin-dependent protein